MQDSTNVGAKPPHTLSDLVDRAARNHPDRPAFHAGGTVLTWRDVDARVTAAARRLAGLAAPATATGAGAPGAAAGDGAADGDGPGALPVRVAIALSDGLDFAITFFATIRAGLIAVPVNPTFTPVELRHVLTDSGAGLLVAAPSVAERLAADQEPLPGLQVVPAARLGDLPAGGDPPAPVPAGAPAALLYTSGTEGRPKGAMLPHSALLANHHQLAALQPPVLGPDDVVLLALPLFHAYGLNAGLGAVAYHGASAVLVDRFDPAETLAAIVRHRVTVLLGVPSMYAAWSGPADVGAAMATVRLAVSGAAPLDTATAERFTAATGRPVHVGYGLTETAAVLTSTLLSPQPKPGSIGRPLPGVQLVLRGADGQVWPAEPAADRDDEPDLDLAATPGTDPGEIVVRGGNVFAGYWPDGRGGPDADGWWGTGDIAYADGDGDLFLVDRIGELILVNGFNVYPREIERVLDAHPGVAESAAIGVPHPVTGQAVKAYVVAATDPPPTQADLLEHCARQLARFKCPAGIELVDRLPHSATGKVRKSELRMETLGG